MPLEKHGESLGELVARIRRSGCDAADLECLLDAADRYAKLKAVEAARRRRWRLAHRDKEDVAHCREGSHP